MFRFWGWGFRFGAWGWGFWEFTILWGRLRAFSVGVCWGLRAAGFGGSGLSGGFRVVASVFGGFRLPGLSGFNIGACAVRPGVRI